ncbi:MAG: hypothetical protein V5A84_02485, partial [Planctomycetota bacterium]
TEATPGAVVGTEWDTSDIWVRRTFALDEEPSEAVSLMMHHDEDAKVYINGVLAAEVGGYTTAYQMFRIRREAARALKQGQNTTASRPRAASSSTPAWCN